MSFVVAERGRARLVVRARELRGDRTLTDVAAPVGMREDELGKIERGQTHAIRLDTLLKLCEAFGVTPSDLFAVEETGSAAPSPLASVLAGVRAGVAHSHAPDWTRARLRDDDVIVDPGAVPTLADREEPQVRRARTRAPATVAPVGNC